MSLGTSRIFTNGRLSIPAVFHPESGDRLINGIFDDAFYNALMGENALEGSLPRLTVQMDYAGVNILDASGDPVPFNVADSDAAINREVGATINGKTYSVLQVQPDTGTGMAVITFAHY